MKPVWTVVITPELAQQRADHAILSAIAEGLGEGDTPLELTRSQLHRLMTEGSATFEGAAMKPGVKLRAGGQVRIELPPPKSMALVPENRALEILFEDESLVVLNKPQGLTVHPSRTQMEGTLVHALLHHVKDLSGIGGVLRPGIVHRIDKDTSGAMVITKTDAAHQALIKTFADHSIERSYWALCYGALETRGGPDLRVESLIGRSPSDRKKMSMEVKEGRRAVTHLRKVEEFNLPTAHPRTKPFASFVSARLETGRTHQVRVHLTGQHNSILGDPVYGIPSEKHPKWLALPTEVRESVRAMPGQALHARVLGFAHPVTGKAMRFEAEPPPAFARLLEALRRYKVGLSG